MVCGCITYKGLCQDPFDILNKCHFKFVQSNQGAKVCFLGTHILTTYQANTASNGSPGFRILFETVVGQVYRLKVTSTLTIGDKAFVYIETPDGCRLVPRTYTFLNGAGATSYQIDFTATECLTFVGILFNSFNQSYSLTTTEFKVSCVEPIDCDQVVACLCQIPVCLDEYTYEICLDFLQVHLDLLNSPASFPPGTALSIQAYRIAEGSLIGATGIPQPIGVVPVTFNQVRTAFENLDWTTVNLGPGEFRASLSNKIEVISHVLIDSTLAPIPPFSINLPTNCTQIDECATEDPANQLLLKRPDNSLCWANICPPKIDICLTKCAAEDHVGILPDETLSDNASISIGPRGSGFLCAQKPIPGSTGGGDCRGSYAVDWQMSRDSSDDVAGGDFSAIGGGLNNQINDVAAFGPVGKLGAIGAKAAVIGGGSGNLVQALADDSNVGYSVIDGGRDNNIGAEALSSTAVNSAIGGGASNLVQALGDSSNVGYSVIGGGFDNLIGADALNGNANLSVIGGGLVNKIVAKNAAANASKSVIAGGSGNKIYAYSSAAHAVIGGGQSNLIRSYGVSDAVHSVIGGGYANLVYRGGKASVIAGGYTNFINNSGGQSTNYNTIGGGRENRISALGPVTTNSAVVAGGRNNQIVDGFGSGGGSYSVIGGGKDHKIQVPYSTIAGGHFNQILGTLKYNSHNAISGGNNNTITNSALTTIIGGSNNSISGASLSVVGGFGSGSNFDNCFVFGVGAGSTGPNQVVFRAIPDTPIPNGLNVVVRPNGILGVGEPFKIKQGSFSGMADWTMTTIGIPEMDITSDTVPFDLMYTCIGFQVDVCLNLEQFSYPNHMGSNVNIVYDIPLIMANLPTFAGGFNIQITSVERPNTVVTNLPVGVLKNMFISNVYLGFFPLTFLQFRLNCVDLTDNLDAPRRLLATFIKICYTNGDPPIVPDA